ncbi:MAG: GNAT family N-acetyltransferase [Calditrichia bacterium]
MRIQYATDRPISANEFIDVLNRSTLGERRPVHNRNCIKGMLQHADILVTAWHGEKLIGISRSVTDFHYACYLSDLAVDQAYQKQGIGIHLMQITQEALGPLCNLILLAAPAAKDYYQHVGFENNPRCWIAGQDSTIGKK